MNDKLKKAALRLRAPAGGTVVDRMYFPGGTFVPKRESSTKDIIKLLKIMVRGVDGKSK